MSSRRISAPVSVASSAFTPARLLLLAVLALVLGQPARAQATPEVFGDVSFPRAIRYPRSKLPRLAFRLHTDIPLPGPLPGGSPRAIGGTTIEVPVEGGLAVTTLASDASPRLLPLPAGTAPPEMREDRGWVVHAEAGLRFRTEPEGLLIAEKHRPRRRRPWRRAWKLRLPGGTVAPPLVSGDRVFVGALDNQIYAVRAKNGHRLWTMDAGRRLSSALALWEGAVSTPGRPGEAPGSRSLRLVLAVPDGGASLLAVDAESGRTVAGFDLPDTEGRIVGAPLAVPDGRVVVARQKYARSEATLMVFRLEPPKNGVLELPQNPGTGSKTLAESADDDQDLP